MLVLVHRKNVNVDRLAELAVQIKVRVKSSRQHDLGRFNLYHSIGVNLIEAKSLCPPGTWSRYVSEHCELDHRQERRYREFAGTDVTSDLEAMEKRWRKINGNGEKKSKGERGKGAELADDGSRPLPIDPLTKELADEMDGLVNDLWGKWGAKNVTDTVVQAIRYAHKEVCRG